MKPIKVPRKPRKCQKCGKTTVVKILYGEPTPEAGEWESAGKVVLGGSIVNEKSAEWACTYCETEYKKIK